MRMLWGHFTGKGEDWLTVSFMKVVTKKCKARAETAKQ